MAQISYIKYTDVIEARRYDAEYFRPYILKLISKIESGKFSRIGKEFDVTKLAGFEYTKYFTKQNIEADDSYIALTSLNIQNEDLVEEGAMKIDKKIADEFLNRSKLHYGDVVLSYTGEYRRSLTILKEDFQLGPNICLLRNKTGLINSFYLSTFLNSRIGQTILDREKTLSGQPTVAMSRIRTIAVPLLNESIQLEIEKNILESKQKQTQSKQLYREAEQLLLAELGLLDYEVKHSLWFTATKNEVSEARRYDSEYFQPKYAEIIKKIENYESGWDLVKNQFKIINGKTPEQYFEEEKEIQVLKTKQIRNEAIQYESVAYSEKEFVTNILQERDVLFASMGVGSLGRTGIFYNFETDKKTSVDSTIKIFRNPKKIEPEVLQTFFNSIIGQEYIYRYVVGSTGIISIKNDFILDLKIPLIKPSIQKQIAEKIQESHKLRKESKELLEEAKRKVEEEIENDV